MKRMRTKNRNQSDYTFPTFRKLLPNLTVLTVINYLTGMEIYICIVYLRMYIYNIYIYIYIYINIYIYYIYMEQGEHSTFQDFS